MVSLVFVFCLNGNPATFSMRRHTHYVTLAERLGGPAPE